MEGECLDDVPPPRMGNNRQNICWPTENQVEDSLVFSVDGLICPRIAGVEYSYMVVGSTPTE